MGELEQFWRSVVVKVNEEMTQLLPMLDGQQQEELFSSIEDENEKFRKKHVRVDDKERVERNENRLLENYETWLGELTNEQALAISRAAGGLQNTADLRLRRRLAWQRGIQDILAADDTRQGKTERLRVFLNEFEERKDSTMQEKWSNNRRIMVKLTVQLAHSLNTDQRAYFMNKTNDYIRMFTELAENR